MSSDETRPLTCLQGRLYLVDYRAQTRNIPTLQDALLARTRNSIRHSPNNNDLLEYLGDRCVNLVIALFVDKVRLNRNHHMVRDVSVFSVLGHKSISMDRSFGVFYATMIRLVVSRSTFVSTSMPSLTLKTRAN